jgi:hypothetical protein
MFYFLLDKFGDNKRKRRMMSLKNTSDGCTNLFYKVQQTRSKRNKSASFNLHGK